MVGSSILCPTDRIRRVSQRCRYCTRNLDIPKLCRRAGMLQVLSPIIFAIFLCLRLFDLPLWLFGKSFWGTNKTTGFYQPQRKECHQIAFETYSILFSFAITYLFNISSFCYSEFNSNVELSQPPVTPASGYPTSSSVHCRNCTHN